MTSQFVIDIELLFIGQVFCPIHSYELLISHHKTQILVHLSSNCCMHQANMSGSVHCDLHCPRIFLLETNMCLSKTNNKNKCKKKKITVILIHGIIVLGI